MKAAVLCPIRINEGDLEVLLTRRAFWNYEKNRPMSYPGEWVFAGGKYETNDSSSLDTAIREFREETGYLGEFYEPKFLISGKSKNYDIDFYLIRIDNDFEHQVQVPNSEIIDNKWMSISAWLSHFESLEYDQEQKLKLKKHGISRREIPFETISCLKYLQTKHLRNKNDNSNYI